MQQESRELPHEHRDRRTRSAALVGGAACVVLFGVAHALNVWAFDRDYGALDAGAGSSVFERVGTAAIAVAAAASLLAGWLGRSSALVLSALLAFLTLDDAIGLHEQVPAWKLVYLPLLTVIAVLLWRLSSVSRFARSTLRIGLALLAFSLVGGEIAERQVVRQGWGPSDLGYELKILVKDGSEVVGWIFVAAGLIAAAVEHPRLGRPVDGTPTARETV